jgi:hypothetical protein
VPNMHVRWLPIVRPASLTQGVDLVPNKHVRWLPILMHGTLFFDAFRKKSLVVMVVHYKRKNKHILMCGALNYPTHGRRPRPARPWHWARTSYCA